MILSWVTQYRDGGPIELFGVDLAFLYCYGVYVIYSPATLKEGPQILRVGQGDIAGRLRAHRTDPRMNANSPHRKMYVAYAEVAVTAVNGVERYLVDQYRPPVADPLAEAAPVPVNLPFAA